MSFPGYVKPTEAMIDAGVLYLRDPANTTVMVGIGPSRGGLTFNPNREMRNVEFDGKAAMIDGLDRVLRTNPQLTGGLIDFSRKSLGYYEPDSTSGDSGSVGRISPIDATVFLAAGAYLKDVMWISRNQDNSITAVGFPRALVTEYEVVGEQDNETIANVTIEARVPRTATNINVAPYRWFKGPSLTALEATLPTFWDIAGYTG
jgi:hypothetical protein